MNPFRAGQATCNEASVFECISDHSPFPHLSFQETAGEQEAACLDGSRP